MMRLVRNFVIYGSDTNLSGMRSTYLEKAVEAALEDIETDTAKSDR
jgi:hypothetical protein